MKQQILVLATTLALGVATGAAQAQSADTAPATPAAAVSPAATGASTFGTPFTPRAYIGLGAATADNLVTGDYRVSPKIFGGYDFTPNWGVEAGYTHFGEEKSYAYTYSQDAGNQVLPYKVKGYSSYVAAKYTIPLSERFSGYGKLGVQHSERTNDIVGLARWTERDTGLYGGLGVQYALNRNLSVTAEYERYGKDKNSGAKADVYTVGLKYGF